MTGVPGKLPTPPLATPELEGWGVPAGVPDKAASAKLSTRQCAEAAQQEPGSAIQGACRARDPDGRRGHGVLPAGCLLVVPGLGKGGISAGLPCNS